MPFVHREHEAQTRKGFSQLYGLPSKRRKASKYKITAIDFLSPRLPTLPYGRTKPHWANRPDGLWVRRGRRSWEGSGGSEPAPGACPDTVTVSPSGLPWRCLRLLSHSHRSIEWQTLRFGDLSLIIKEQII